MPWRPPSKRHVRDVRLDEPHEGLPSHLRGPVIAWVERVFTNTVNGMPIGAALLRFQLDARLEDPLHAVEASAAAALRDLLGRAAEDQDFALDVVDFALFHLTGVLGHAYRAPEKDGAALDGLLRLGGSVWEVVVSDDPDGDYRLSRRAIGPVREAIYELPASSRAAQHLALAWNALSGRDPDPSTAYREAVRAVEAAAKPVVLPTDRLATLGKMIRAIEDKPEKWSTTLGEPPDVARMMAAIWTGQLDRHGTDDESVPLTVTGEQADAAFYVALALVRSFVGGHIHRK